MFLVKLNISKFLKGVDMDNFLGQIKTLNSKMTKTRQFFNSYLNTWYFKLFNTAVIADEFKKLCFNAYENFIMQITQNNNIYLIANAKPNHHNYKFNMNQNSMRIEVDDFIRLAYKISDIK